MNRLQRLCLPCTLVPLPALALAVVALQAAADPMRPLKPPAPATAKDANGKPLPGRKTTGEVEEAAPPRIALMALRLNSDGRWRALVGDQWLSVGDRLGPRVVVAIDSNRLELTDGPQRITVHLLPWLQPGGPVETPAGEPARDSEVRQARAPVEAREGPRKP